MWWWWRWWSENNRTVGIYCWHYALCLFLFETNSKIKQVPNYSHIYKAEKKNKLKKCNITQLCICLHHSLPFVSSRNVRDKKRLRGRKQFTLSFFNLTTLKTM